MKEDCIFIVGPESSGSTLIAKIVNTALGNGDWTGRGFNCCDIPKCDEATGYVTPCRLVENLVCHRSLPFKQHTWPPIAEWNSAYNAKYIICTRDKNISRISQQTRFKWKNDELLGREKKRVASILDGLILDTDTPAFIWSYESFILLGAPYLALLADFLDIPRMNFERCEAPLNGNLKYIQTAPKRSLWSKWVRG